MDRYPTAPFSPPFYSRPMTFDDGSDVPLDDWLQNDWAPTELFQSGPFSNTTRPHSFLEETVSSALAKEHKFPSTNQYLGLFSALPDAGTPSSAATSQSLYTNQLIQVADDGIIASELMSLGFNCEDQPIRLDSSSDNEVINAPSNPSPISNIYSFSDSHGSRSLTSTLNGNDQIQHGARADILRLTDLQYLARLPHSVLEEISNTIGKALIVTNNKPAQKLLQSRQGTQAQLLEGKKAQNITSGSKGVFRCEHPGCSTIFRRNKDRLRHVRQKHAKDAKTFICPVVDCPMGFKHEFHRTDKLRDHLRGERISSYQWTCVIPDCPEVAASRVGLIDHLGGHDYASRRSNFFLLGNYGFLLRSDYWESYLLARYICSIEGCPFGTDDEACMSNHESIPHDGPFCPCPIPDCQVVCEDWLSVSKHLARAHDYITKQRFRNSVVNQHHNYDIATILCPICSHEMIKAKSREVRDQWQTHSPEQRLQGWEAILNAWVFAFGPKVSLMRKSGSLFRGRNITLTDDMALAYLDLSSEELSKLTTNEEVMREGKRLRASFELRRNVQQS